MSSQRVTTVLTYGILSLAGIFSFSLPKSLVLSSAGMVQAPPDLMQLSGIIHDFSSTHPDFNIIDPAVMGHYVGTVAPTLDMNGQPVPLFVDAGQQVTSEWYDKNGNPIVPYTGPGLPGGHFDVDIYDGPSITEVYHEHAYDDDYNITYVDVFDNPLLEGFDFKTFIGAGYPNNLRLEFLNVHNGGGGQFKFKAGGPTLAGKTSDGFTTTFDPALLTKLRVSFVALAALRATEPHDSQGDVVDRDDAFHLRMYDDVTNALVYELAVYHHFKANEVLDLVPVGELDACGVAIADIAGSYGLPGNAGITNAGSFGQWFRDELGTNQSTGHTISLQRDAMGVYEYLTNNFYPIDNRLIGNEGDTHNNYFTYSFSASFTYDQCTSQFFEFASNDDAWVFIDDKLVVDLGGTATTTRQYVNLDRLGLVQGQVYTLDFFFAHRRNAIDSLFNMRTNILLNTGTLPSITGFYD